MKRSKSYEKADAGIDHDALYQPAEAVALAKQAKQTAFDSTVEVALRLGVDPRKADQMVRGTVNLPHGTGKTARVLVFADGWTSTPSWPPPTSWGRSDVWAVCSVPVGSCRTRRPGR